MNGYIRELLYGSLALMVRRRASPLPPADPYGPEIWQHSQATVVGEAEILGYNRYRIYTSDGVNSYVQMPSGAVNQVDEYLVRLTVEEIITGSVHIGNIGGAASALGVTERVVMWNTDRAFFKRSDPSLTDVIIRDISIRKVL